MSGGGGGGIAGGLRHMRSEWGRWWRAEDLADTHIAHRILNDQYRLWRQLQQRVNAEVKQNITLLQQQQRQQTYMQMQRIQQQKRSRGHGYGGYGFGSMGASPMISYRMMQWAQLQIRIGQEEFRHLEVTESMLQIGRGQVRSRRHLAAVAWIVVLPVLWVGLWWISALAGFIVTALAAAAFIVLVWTQGRRPTRRRPPVPKLLFVPPAPPAHTELTQDPEPEPEPFPIREAGRDPKRTQEAIRLALRKERAQIAEVTVPAETDWGWSVRLVLSGGTLGDLVRLLPGVATTLRVGPNRLLAQLTNTEDSADITLRILTSDPFATPLPYPERAPASCSITQPVSLGLSIEGETTPVVLAGQHVIVVGDTGSGKTAMVQAIAEYVTACRDAVIVDVDPVKRGLKALGPMAVLTARTPEEAEAVLKSLLERVRQRVASMPPIQDMWEPTPDAPAVIVVIDEYTMLTSGGKEAAIDILRTGREAMVTLVILTQDATSAVLGDAIADAFGVRILMPCRAADVPVTIGRADAISQGWLPHLLVPSPEKNFPADAGRFYCITPRHRHPMLRYVSPLPPAEADRRARERLAAGLPRLETPALIATLPADAPQILRLLLKAFAAHGNPEHLTLTQLADHFTAADPATWGKWDGRPNRLLMVGRTIQSHLRQAELDIQSTRLNHEVDPKRPAIYRLADIQRALS